MRRLSLLLILVVFCAVKIRAATPPARDEVLKSMIKVNDYVMKRYSDPKAPMVNYTVNKMYASNIWTRAVYYEGLMALYSIYPDNRYYDYTYQWAEFHKWGMRNDETFTRNADNYCCAQVYIDMYRLCPDPAKLLKTLSCMNMLVNTPQVEDWTWIDAIHMGMPVLAKMASLTGDSRYSEKAWEMYEWSRNNLAGGLYNEKEGLWWRDKNFVPPYKEPNGRNCYWSRGNGWVVAALVRVLEELPQDDSHRQVYIRDLQTMCNSLKECQREDGFWNVSLHDQTNYGGKEASGTLLFIYGMAWGVNNGVLDRQTYLPIIEKAWNAIIQDSIHPNGFIGYLQGSGKEPKDSQPVTYRSKPDFEDYGAGCFLLAGSEVYKLD